jgi:hypothetical protein
MIDGQARASDFFKAGGTLHPGVLSYVKRPTDDELFERVLAGRLCYVLTSRQRGKSSLMVRTAERLRERGVHTAIVDLSGLGTQLTREQWYLGIVTRLARDLKLAVDPERWWIDRNTLGPVQRFSDFLHDVVLAEIDQPIAIFIDEIDSTLRLDFRDDFFAAIRAANNLRASNPEYDRLTFVLLGVAAPTDLIKAPNRTPFNIGHAINLQEFSRADACPLEEGLNQFCAGHGKAILDRIFYWTNGHPYLTQKLCLEIARSPEPIWRDDEVDALVARLFLAEEAKSEDNLQFVRGSIKAGSDRRQLVQLYRRVYQGEAVVEDERSPIQNRLRLIGLVRADKGMLQVSNRIYRNVFDLNWIKENSLLNWSQIVVMGAAAAIVLGIALGIYLVYTQQQRERAITVQFYTEGFQSASTADVRMSNLAGLCRIGGYADAPGLFFAQPPQEQLNLFDAMQSPAGAVDLSTLVECISPEVVQRRVEDAGHREALIGAIYCAITRVEPGASERYSERVGRTYTCPAAARSES